MFLLIAYNAEDAVDGAKPVDAILGVYATMEAAEADGSRLRIEQRKSDLDALNEGMEEALQDPEAVADMIADDLTAEDVTGIYTMADVGEPYTDMAVYAILAPSALEPGSIQLVSKLNLWGMEQTDDGDPVWNRYDDLGRSLT